MKHNILSPANAGIWYYCNGSHVMQGDEPKQKSESVRENIACHTVAAKCLSAYANMGTQTLLSNDFVNKETFENVMVDQEMYEAAQMYVMDILKYCNLTGLIRFVHIEENVHIDGIFPGMTGYPDAWIYNPEALEIIIWKLEYNYGHVEVFENPELMTYIKGIMDTLRIDGISDQQLTIKMRVVQPRSYRNGPQTTEWIVNAAELRPYFNSLANSAHTTMNKSGTCNPGLHCRKCRARNKCEAFTKTVYNGIDVITGIAEMNLKGNDLSVELKLIERIYKLVDYRYSALKTQAKIDILKGDILPDWKLEESYGRKRWRKDTDTSEVLMMGDAMGIDLRKPDNLDTPTQALVKFKKMAKKMGVDLDENLVKQYFETPKNGLKLVENDGKLAKQVFGN
jgi:hypothetical protein